MAIVDTDEEARILNAWPRTRGEIVKDGVVDPEHYKGILFLLKEANDPGQNDWSLVDFLRSGGIAPTWNNVARWTYGLLKKPDYPPFSEVPFADKDFRREWLSKIAVVNLKKTGGGGSSKRKELEQAVKDHRTRLREQLALYHPRVTICGGTFGMLPRLCDDSELGPLNATRGLRYYKSSTLGLMLGTYHPQARIKAEHMYSRAMGATQEIMSDVKW